MKLSGTMHHACFHEMYFPQIFYFSACFHWYSPNSIVGKNGKRMNWGRDSLNEWFHYTQETKIDLYMVLFYVVYVGLDKVSFCVLFRWILCLVVVCRKSTSLGANFHLQQTMKENPLKSSGTKSNYLFKRKVFHNHQFTILFPSTMLIYWLTNQFCDSEKAGYLHKRHLTDI